VTIMKQTADRLFGDDYVWSVLAAGRHQMSFCTNAAMLGGSVRVGLEDSLYLAKSQMARSNAEQVAKIKRIVEELSLDVATPTEARQMLTLKGGDNVGF
ncbi:MAG: 3-keto-5-aminohexanoate cleavage protein, partial [Pseudomonadota bacterium]